MGQMMRLSIAVRNEILEHARDAADVEVCGLLFGEGDRIDRAMGLLCSIRTFFDKLCSLAFRSTIFKGFGIFHRWVNWPAMIST